MSVQESLSSETPVMLYYLLSDGDLRVNIVKSKHNKYRKARGGRTHLS